MLLAADVALFMPRLCRNDDHPPPPSPSRRVTRSAATIADFLRLSKKPYPLVLLLGYKASGQASKEKGFAGPSQAN